MWNKEVIDLITTDTNAFKNLVWLLMSFAMVVIPLCFGFVSLFTKTDQQRNAEKALVVLKKARVMKTTYNTKSMLAFAYALIGPNLDGILLPRDDILVMKLHEGIASELTSREIAIAEDTWGLNGEKQSLRAIGAKYGISGARVSVINRVNIRRKLRQWFRRQGIKIPVLRP